MSNEVEHQEITGFTELFGGMILPEITISISGNAFSGKTHITAKIAQFITEEYGYPVRVVSSDCDFQTTYRRLFGVEPNSMSAINRKPRCLDLKPVRITITDINAPYNPVEYSNNLYQFVLT